MKKQKRLKVGFLGDLHLGKPRLLKLFGEAVTKMMLDSVRMQLDRMIRMGTRHAFFLGDICDSWSLRDADELALQNLLFDYDGKISIHIILGNHDIEQKTVNSMCKIQNLVDRGVFQSVRLYNDHTNVRLDGVRVEFMPYPHRDPTYTNSLCIAHITRPGSIRDNGTVSAEGTPEPEGTNVWFIGHLHTPQTVGRSRYPGAGYQTYFGEHSRKKWVTAEFWMEGDVLHCEEEWEDAVLPFELATVDAAEYADPKFTPYPAENIRYRLMNGAGVNLPENFLVDNPNVIEVDRAVKRDAPDLDEINESEGSKVTDIDRQRDRYLRKQGHRRPAIVRAREIVELARNKELA